jgi:hypothetical protein
MPNSILWIALVGMWLFVLLPMQVKRRPLIRQTTDAALATRVLDRDQLARQQHRGPASGHRSDPNWRREPTRPRYAEDRMDTQVEVDELDDERAAAREYVPQRRGRGGFDPEADALARAARYGFRQRAVLGLVLLTIMSAALALILTPLLWWVAAAAFVGLGGYLAYMRRQVQFEQEIRRRRMARLSRSRLGVESREDDELRLIPSRLRRPGAVVLEVDDEDPVFEHLEHYDVRFEEEAAPQEMRRVVGQ